MSAPHDLDGIDINQYENILDENLFRYRVGKEDEKHIYLRHKCDLCFQSMEEDEETIASKLWL
jgi:hypothetical protein